MASILLTLFPAAWLLGVSFALPGLAFLALLSRPRRLSRRARLIFLVPGMLSISLLLNLINNGYEFRALSAFYNIYVWIGGTSMFVLMEREGARLLSNTKRTGLENRIAMLASLILALGAVPAALWALGVLARDTTVPTVLGSLTHGTLPGILRFYSFIELVRPDYFLGTRTVRFVPMGIYPNEGALLVGSWGLLWLAFRARTCRRVTRSFLIDIAVFLVAALTASRGAVMAYAAAAVLVSVPSLGGSGQAKMANIGLRTFLLVAVLALGLSQSASIMETLSQLRAGSSLHRLQSYAYAISLTLEHNLFFGMGIKPFDADTLNIPIGSHSTLVSLFTKGGLLALTAVVVALSRVAWPYLRSAVLGFGTLGETSKAEVRTTKYFARAVVFCLLWCLFEDIDAPALGALTFFSVLGLSTSWVRFLSDRRLNLDQ